MHCLSVVYWIIAPLHVSGISAAHHQEVECIYVASATGYTSKLTVSGPGWNGTDGRRRLSYWSVWLYRQYDNLLLCICNSPLAVRLNPLMVVILLPNCDSTVAVVISLKQYRYKCVLLCVCSFLLKYSFIKTKNRNVIMIYYVQLNVKTLGGLAQQ
jgi:hypothetical protein